MMGREGQMLLEYRRRGLESSEASKYVNMEISVFLHQTAWKTALKQEVKLLCLGLKKHSHPNLHLNGHENL